MRRCSLLLLLFCLVSAPAYSEATAAEIDRLLSFDGSGRLIDPEVKKAAGLQFDAFAALTPFDLDIKVGLGLVVWRRGKLRATAQIANRVVGAGLGWTIIPVVDVSIGVSALYDVSASKVEPAVFCSLFHW